LKTNQGTGPMPPSRASRARICVAATWLIPAACGCGSRRRASSGVVQESAAKFSWASVE